jgi:hypothetical protein
MLKQTNKLRSIRYTTSLQVYNIALIWFIYQLNDSETADLRGF